jgi:outer membrane receptor for ferrienterochelin and colicin
MRKLLFLISLCFYSLNSYGIENNLKSSEAQSSRSNQSSLTLEKIIVTAPKNSLTSDDFSTAQEKINQISGSASIVNSKELENKFSYNVKDMFDYVAGIVAQSKAGQESRLSIRGS